MYLICVYIISFSTMNLYDAIILQLYKTVNIAVALLLHTNSTVSFVSTSIVYIIIT